jgi:glycosyltransferase involved in cell wall biosynthesis
VKICYVVDTTVGAHWAFEQLRELRNKCGFEVTAIVSGHQGSLVDKLRSEGIPLYAWSFSFSGLIGICALPLRVLRLARLFRRERFDVVQTHLFRSMIIGRLAAWLADVPVRLTMIAGPYYLETHTLRWLDGFTCWMETTLIASCEYTRRLYLEMGVPHKRLALIYYGPDERAFDPGQVQPADLRAEFGWEAETPLIGMVACFYPPSRISGHPPRNLYGRGIKGQEYLIKAAPAVLAEFPEAKFLLIGSAFSESRQKYMEELRELVARLGLQ